MSFQISLPTLFCFGSTEDTIYIHLYLHFHLRVEKAKLGEVMNQQLSVTVEKKVNMCTSQNDKLFNSKTSVDPRSSLKNKFFKCLQAKNNQTSSHGKHSSAQRKFCFFVMLYQTQV